MIPATLVNRERGGSRRAAGSSETHDVSKPGFVLSVSKAF